MKRLFRDVLVASAMAFTGACLAQGYIGGSVGQSDFDIDCAGTTSCDTKDTGFKFFGGYMFNKYVGIEGMYADLGKATQAGVAPGLGTVNAEITGTGFGVFAVGVYPIEQFSVFGKLGLARVKTEVSGRALGIGVNAGSETKTGVAWGLGAGYDFTKNLGIRGDWERFRGEFQGEKSDADLLSVGVKFTF
jgi:OOP family OmpA-OmpF porin